MLCYLEAHFEPFDPVPSREFVRMPGLATLASEDTEQSMAITANLRRYLHLFFRFYMELMCPLLSFSFLCKRLWATAR